MEFNLADLFECVADHVPDHAAVVAGDRRLTYAQLDDEATRVAQGLAAHGVHPGDHVGLALRDGVEHLELMLACYKLRAVPVNVNHRYVAGELAALCADADLVALAFPRRHAARVAGLAVPRLIEVDDDPDAPPTPGAIPFADLLTGSPLRSFGPRSADDRYVLYTGGTTGQPRGVVWRQ